MTNIYTLRVGDVVEYAGQPCRVLRVSESAAVVAVIQKPRTITPRFGKPVTIQPRRVDLCRIISVRLFVCARLGLTAGRFLLPSPARHYARQQAGMSKEDGHHRSAGDAGNQRAGKRLKSKAETRLNHSAR